MTALRLPQHPLLAFARFLARRFNDDQCFEAAGALSFTTVFALVPLLTVALSLFASFQEFSRFSDAVTQFAFRHFVPASGVEVEAYIRDFVSKASHLTAVGTVALFVSGLLLMTSIEHAFNRIWRVVAYRQTVARFLVFWTVLTLGPLMVGAALAVSSALLAYPLLADAAQRFQIETLLLSTLPFLIVFAAATAAYLIVPNCPVRLRHAVLGGLFAAAAFELAKRGFAWFVGQFATYQQIYGAVAFIPVFLLWIYISWVIALIGASLTAALGAFASEAGKRDLPERERLKAMLRLLLKLRDAQAKGIGLSVGELAASLPDVPEATIAELLGFLERQRIVQRSDIGSWLLSRDPDLIRVRALFRDGNFVLPLSHGRQASSLSAEDRVEALCENASSAAERALDVAIVELYKRSPRHVADSKESAASPVLDQNQ